MPISRKENPLGILSYFRNNPRKHRITFEYILLKNVNDSLEDAAKVARLVQGIPCKVNIIPYNENEHIAYETPSRGNVDAFCEYLNNRNLTVITRWSKGREIKSACGQLATEI
jgi:23S rRNA (adenine2503-C2)-methyltransferase